MPWSGENVSLTAYSGLVPMSPNTTPSASERQRGPGGASERDSWSSIRRRRASYARTAQNANSLLSLSDLSGRFNNLAIRWAMATGALGAGDRSPAGERMAGVRRDRLPCACVRGRLPPAAGAVEPRPYPIDYYLGWARALGIARCVQVTASCYGFDNSITRFAMDECRAGGIAVRGIAIVHPDIEEAELASLSKDGFIGARLMDSRVASLEMDAFESLARRCAAWRWHIELNADRCEAWRAMEERLALSPVPLVFEHLGIGSGEGPETPGVHCAVLRPGAPQRFRSQLRVSGRESDRRRADTPFSRSPDVGFEPSAPGQRRGPG